MPSTSRLNQITQSLVYHVINRGNARSVIYHQDEDFMRFISILAAYSANCGVKVYHWVLMPNHFHLLLELAVPKELSRIMAGIARSYVHYHHRKYRASGHLFQGRFKSQAVNKEFYMLACGRYIERNPVNAGLTKSAYEYQYSSAAYYCLGRRDSLTTEDPYYLSFGSDNIKRQEKYRLFLEEFNSDEDRSFSNLETPIGSEEFVSRLIKQRGIFVPRSGRPRKQKFIRNSLR